MAGHSANCKPYRVPGPGFWLPATLVGAVATVISVFLLAGSLSSSGHVVGCTGNSSCDELLASRWSSWLGIPVSGGAVLLYLLLTGSALASRFSPEKHRKAVWSMMLAASLLATGAGTWFATVAWGQVNALCSHCLATHACGFVLLVLIWYNAPLGRGRLVTPRLAAKCAAVAGMGMVALVGGQLLGGQDDTIAIQRIGQSGDDYDRGTDKQRKLSALGGKIELRPHELPTIGSPDAPHIILSFFDYTCPHCRTTHWYLKQIPNRYGDKVAIVVLPVPLEAKCNRHMKQTRKQHVHACELATIALCVWRADATKFAEFDHWMFTKPDKKSRTPEEARAYAHTLVGAEKFAESETDSWAAMQVKSNIHILSSLNPPAVPMIVARSLAWRWPGTAKELYAMIETEYGIKALMP